MSRSRWGRLAVVVAALAAMCTATSCQKQVEQGVQRAAEKKMDERLYGGGQLDNDATLEYASQLSFDLSAARNQTPDKTEILVTGVARNAGDRTVTWLKLAVGLVDSEGVEVAGGSDIVAHTLPVGENNTPLRPQSAKRITIHVDSSVDPAGLKVVPHVVELATK